MDSSTKYYIPLNSLGKFKCQSKKTKVQNAPRLFSLQLYSYVLLFMIPDLPLPGIQTFQQISDRIRSPIQFQDIDE